VHAGQRSHAACVAFFQAPMKTRLRNWRT
jgi:hypothetical protein